MKKLLRKYIREQVEKLFEAEPVSKAEDAAKANAGKTAAETIKNYEDIKAQQLAQIDTLNKSLQREKLRKKLNDDKLLKLTKTFSQVQDPELAQIQGGKGEDNKVKTMKKTDYSKKTKELVDSVQDIEDQIAKAEQNVTDIEKMIKGTSLTTKNMASPSTPTTPTSMAAA